VRITVKSGNRPPPPLARDGIIDDGRLDSVGNTTFRLRESPRQAR
jgi:hypothetical protein